MRVGEKRLSQPNGMPADISKESSLFLVESVESGGISCCGV